jgi:hypothetical protein
VNCLAFERLLDAGVPEQLPAEALAHAETCASCARSLSRARSLEHALETHFSFSADPAPPAGFADRVMARVERGEARGVRWLTLPSALPWWTRVPTDPGVVLALATVALFVWRGERWQAAARAAWNVLAAAPERASAWLATTGLAPVADAFARAFSPPATAPLAVQLAVVLGVAPLLLYTGWLAWRAGVRLVAAAAPR